MPLLRRIANLIFRAKLEREIDAELQSHVEMCVEDAVARGIPPAEARRQALLRFGNPVATHERVFGEDAALALYSFWWDLRYASRQFRKTPAFAATAISVLALGIGASIALFAFVDAALIRPLPYAAPGRLADVMESALPLFPRSNLSYPDYLDWKRMNTVFRSLEVYWTRGFLLSTSDGTEAVRGAAVSAGFFHTLGVKPPLGSGFRADADQPQAPRTVVLSYGVWQRRFGGRKDVIGQAVTLDGDPATVVGVLPRTFHFGPVGDAEFWIPLQVGPPGPQTPYCYTHRDSHCLSGVGRLKDGVSIAEARSQMETIAANLARQYPDSNRGQRASVMPLSEAIIGKVRPVLLALLAGAGLLLAIACINVSSLLLVRSENRRREVALRSVLGASQGRLLRQFVTEALLLVACGGLLGIAIADAAMQALFRLIPTDMLASMPYLDDLGLTPHVLGFAGAVCAGAAVLFSLTPRMRLAINRENLRDGLAEGGRAAAGVAWRRFGANLVPLELAIAMVLLAGAGLLGKSLYRLLHVELGFDPEHLAAMEVALPDKQYAKDDQQRAAAREILRRLSALPGVSGVGTSNDLALNHNDDTRWVRFVGRPYNGEHNEVLQREVSAGYLQTLGAKLVRGRYFTDAEDNTKPKVVIINQAFARKYYPGEDPIGKQFGGYELKPDSIWTVIGIVGNVREGGLDEDVWPAIYEAYNQSPDTYMWVVARTHGDVRALLPAMVKAVHDFSPGIAVFDETTMSARIDNSPAAYLHRSAAWLVGGFASLALLLGVVGLYGVIAYSVSQRTREIGVRMALGAARGRVTWLILKEAGRLVAVGVAAGMVCSVAAAMMLRRLLFATEAWDMPTLAAVATMLGIAAMVASYLPAHRAASVNPVDALRAE